MEGTEWTVGNRGEPLGAAGAKWHLQKRTLHDARLGSLCRAMSVLSDAGLHALGSCRPRLDRRAWAQKDTQKIQIKKTGHTSTKIKRLKSQNTQGQHRLLSQLARLKLSRRFLSTSRLGHASSKARASPQGHDQTRRRRARLHSRAFAGRIVGAPR